MGVYREYMEAGMGPAEMAAERVRQLARLRAARGRPVVILAASLLGGQGTGLGPDDSMALEDLTADLEADALDVVLQVSGGPLESAEELLHVLRSRCQRFAVLVPRQLRNPGSLLAFAADELVLRPLAQVQLPVPQVLTGGRVVPADLLAAEAAADPLDRAMAQGALALVRAWIREWAVELRGMPEAEARLLAEAVTDCRRHGLATRSLRAAQLRELGMPVRLSREDPEVDDALTRLDALLQLGLGAGKLVETEAGRILRGPAERPRVAPQVTPQPPVAPAPTGSPPVPRVAVFDVHCECGTVSKVQANLGVASPLQDGHWAFPPDDLFHCPDCMRRKDLGPVRRQVEEQTGQRILT